MRLIDELRAEHARIEAVVGALRTWSSRLVRGEAPLRDRDGFVHFFRVYAGAFHHEREESLLFPALEQDAQLPCDRGPVPVLLDDHERMAATLNALAGATDAAEIDARATEYSHALWLHIDVENSVLFPESEHQLRRNGVREIAARQPSLAELDAAAIGDLLIGTYPPMEPDIARGDGCVMCHAYGTTCRGLEREWWNEWEWEELSERVAGA